ncbi:sigma-70 family RNA polymerase sigma factor [Aquimarina sp. 2201CG5-10]|uniref:RNA polymerase sigma factor n=1 Tax=Aquimarina callyspongiae TaxID=3098150 RepID=UPI002AB3BBE7|nr:sigma-70 family RNA polymerase sigma factor [Aquimarina sp. 2201CG5-10]MDY8136926.1 sigma-70 family RNA polymerase sigma factor [Aquimarina sp. 2201CG5-10]
MKINNIKNQKILEEIILGNEVVIKAFYKRNLRYMRRFILENSGREEDIEDIVQDAMVILYQKLKSGPFVLSSSLQTYFYGICKNIWMNQLRRKEKLIIDNVLVVQSKQVSFSIIDAIETDERRSLYQKHFQALSESNRKLLALFFDGKSMCEIAKITGYSEGYVRKKKFKSKKALIEMIENDLIYQELKAS